MVFEAAAMAAGKGWQAMPSRKTGAVPPIRSKVTPGPRLRRQRLGVARRILAGSVGASPSSATTDSPQRKAPSPAAFTAMA